MLTVTFLLIAVAFGLGWDWHDGATREAANRKGKSHEQNDSTAV